MPELDGVTILLPGDASETRQDRLAEEQDLPEQTGDPNQVEQVGDPKRNNRANVPSQAGVLGQAGKLGQAGEPGQAGETGQAGELDCDPLEVDRLKRAGDA